jgi:hypothetical protein
LVIAIRGLRFVPRQEKDLDPRDVLRVDVLGSAGPGLGMTDHVRGKQFQYRTLVEALKLGEPFRVARSLAYYGVACAAGGKPAFTRTMEIGRLVEPMARDLEKPYLLGLASGVSAFAHYLSGDPGKARAYFERAEAIFRDQCVGASHELASVRMLLYRALVPLGDLTTLARLAEASLHDAEERNDIYTVVNIRTNSMSFLALVRDDVNEAQRELDRASAHLSKTGLHVQHAYALLAQAQVWMYGGEAAAVHAEMTHRWPAIKRSLLLRVQNIRILLHEAHARACVALVTAGAPHATRHIAERLLRALEREDIPWASAQVALLRAALALHDGQRDRALALVASSEATFRSLGMQLNVAIAKRRRGSILGGDEGGALVAESEAWMRSQGIESPLRMSALSSPGFPDAIPRV